MTFVNVARFGVVNGARGAFVSLLTQQGGDLAALGCLRYDVGVSDDDPDAVFVVEEWTTAEAHRASLDDPAVQAAIAQARPLLSGGFAGMRFRVAGSPLT